MGKRRMKVDRECPCSAVWVADMLERRYEAMLAQAPKAEQEDVEAIHDLRVASRRLRATLSGVRDVLRPKRLAHVGGYVRDITRLLGAGRELDVTITLTKTWLKDAPTGADTFLHGVLDSLRTKRKAEAGNIRAAAELAGSLRLRTGFTRLTADVAMGACLRQQAGRQIARSLKTARRAFITFQEKGEPDALHQTRIALKRLRYTCELFANVLGAPIEEYIRVLKREQESLGDWNDQRILLAIVEATAKEDGAMLTPGAAWAILSVQEHCGELLTAAQAGVEAALTAGENLPTFEACDDGCMMERDKIGG